MNASGRLSVAVVIAFVVVGGGLALEEVVGTAAPAPADRVLAPSDAWFCPHGGGEGARAWVVVSNPGEAPATITVITHGGDQPAEERATLEPGRQRIVPVAATSAGGTVVESLDARIGVGMVVARSGDGGLAAEPCARHAATRWYIPDGSTVRGEGAQVVVMNPTHADAVVDVALMKDDEVVEPGRLEGIVMEPGEVVSLDLGTVALGERTLTAIVTASLGEVVAAGVGSSADSLRSMLAVAAPGSLAVLQGAVDAREGEVVVMAPAGDVPLVATAVGPDVRTPLLEDAAVEDGTAEGFGIEGGDVSVIVEGRGTGPFVAGRRLGAAAGATSDEGATAGARSAAAAWIVPSPLTPEGGRSLLSLHNPGTAPARVSVTLLTPEGARRPQDLAAIAVPPGQTVVVGLTEPAAEAPVTAFLEATGGSIVATQTGVSEQGYAVVSGVPWTPVSPG